jgi:hypothetical protein
MRAVTVSQMGILLVGAGASGARVRIGIYQNASNTNNLPAALIVDAGELDITSTGAKIITGLSVNLATDTRYWIALIGNTAAGAGFISGSLPAQVIPLGAYMDSTTQLFRTATGLSLAGQTYGALPIPFPAVDSSALHTIGNFRIYLGFSSVT